MFLTPRPAGRLLRRRAGLRGHRRRQGRSSDAVRDASRPSTRTSRSSPASTLAAADRFATDAPLYQHIADARRSCARPTRRSRAARRSSATPTTAPVSTRSAASTATRRSSTSSRRNNATTDKTVSVPTLTTDASFTPLYGGGAGVHDRRDRRRIRHRPRPVGRGVHGRRPGHCAGRGHCAHGRRTRGRRGTDRARTRRAPTSPTRGPRRASRGASSATTSGRRSARPKTRRPASSTTSRALADGTLVEYRAVSTDAAGTRSAASTYASVGNGVTTVPDEPEEPESPVEPEPQEADAVHERQRPGQLQQRGRAAPATGSPTATNVQMEKADGIWRLTLPDLAAGSYEYKIATEKQLGRELRRRRRARTAATSRSRTRAARSRSTSTRARRTSASTADGPIVTLAGLVPERARLRRRLGARLPGRDDVRPQRRRRLPVHDGRPAHRLVRGQGHPRSELGRELRRRRCPGRRRTSPSPRAPARSSRSCTTSRLTSSRCRPATRRSRARASCARTGSTPRRSPGRPTSARPPRVPPGSCYASAEAALAAADGEVTGGDPIDLTRDRRRADRRAEGALPGTRRRTSRSASPTGRMPPPC